MSDKEKILQLETDIATARIHMIGAINKHGQVVETRNLMIKFIDMRGMTEEFAEFVTHEREEFWKQINREMEKEK